MKWSVSVLRESGETERTEVADFELSAFFARISAIEGKASVLSVERVADIGDSVLVKPARGRLSAGTRKAPLVRQGRPEG